LIFALHISPLALKIRTFDHDDFTRIVFESDNNFFYVAERASEKDITIYVKDHPGDILIRSDLSGSELLNRVERVSNGKETGVRIKGSDRFEILKSFVLKDPFRVVFDVNRKSAAPDPKPAVSEPEQEQEEGVADISTFSTGKKKSSSIDVICIDPGHGGSDLGAVGVRDTKEKDVTLKVSNKLKKKIERELGIRVVMTRESDVEVALDSRVAKANNQNSQLFLSIHVNSSYKKSARGPETYFVSLKATDKVSMQLAMKENSSFGEMDDVPEDDDLKMILWSMAQTEHIKESSILADYIQEELNIILNTKNRGVKQAPFRVLMRASMPAVLIEIAFVSNKYEENRLRDDSFLEKIAESIYNGVSKYIYHYNSTFK